MSDTILCRRPIKSIAANDTGLFVLTSDDEIYVMSNVNVWLKLPALASVEISLGNNYDCPPNSSDTLENR